MSLRVTHSVIGRIVCDNTSFDTNPTADSQFLLLKYLRDPKTTDIVYLKVVERLQTDKSQSSQVLSKTLKLLKLYLPKYTPSNETLSDLDAFLATLDNSKDFKISENEGVDLERNARTTKYVRSIIARSQEKITNSRKQHRTLTIDVQRARYSERYSEIKSPTSSSELNRLFPRDLAPAESLAKEFIISNLLLKRLNKKSTETILFPRSHFHSLVLLPMFGGQFNLLQLNPGVVELAGGDTLRIKDSAHISERVRTVTMAKKAEELKAKGGSGVLAVRMKGLQLFQFKYYKEQEPLHLSDEETELVVNAVVNPPESDPETRIIASKILIKILVDTFIHEGERASQLLLSMVSEMLESSDINTQLHAFNLVLNLSVHFNMWDDISLVPTDNSTDNENRNSLNVIEVVQSTLFDVLIEMCQQLILQEDSVQDFVWRAALNGVLFWSVSEGKFEKKRLDVIPLSVIVVFLRKISVLSDVLHRYLIRMFCNKLYAQGSLDRDMLKSCGISFVIEQYIKIRSCEAKDNLFLLIFDFLNPPKKHKKKKDDADHFDELELLRRIEAPQFFSEIFVRVPRNFIKRVVDFIYAKFQPSKLEVPPSPNVGSREDPDHVSSGSPPTPSGHGLANISSNSLLSLVAPSVSSASGARSHRPPSSAGGSLSVDDFLQRIDREQITNILRRFKTLAKDYQKMDVTTQRASVELISNVEINVANSFSDIQGLLFSSSATERRNGELWLWSLWELNLSGSKLNPAIIQAAESTLKILPKKENPAIRRIFLSIYHRIILFTIQKMTLHDDIEQNKKLMTYLNECFGSLVAYKETCEDNLLYMFDLLCLVVINYINPRTALGAQEIEKDMPYSLFLRGSAVIPQKMIALLDITNLKWLFQNLSHKDHPEVRVVLLLMIIDKCKTAANLEKIGGVVFFRNLLVCRDSDVAYHASRFLVDLLESEKPDEYRAIMSKLLNKAQQTNNDKLLANSYLQIKAIIGGI